ncbi:MAG: peptidase E [bacterium]|nr:peptidase E [bacterium]
MVAGESAGANCLSTYCYSKSGGGVISGLGMTPVKLIPHYNGEHEVEFKADLDQLELVLLSDYQYKVIYN